MKPQNPSPSRIIQGPLLGLCDVWKLAVLAGSWVDISGVISPRIKVITIVSLLITLLITTHESQSKMLR